MKIHISDGRRINYCVKGMRRFCEVHGISWTEAVKNGIDEETLLATKSAAALRLVESARGVVREDNDRV